MSTSIRRIGNVTRPDATTGDPVALTRSDVNSLAISGQLLVGTVGTDEYASQLFYRPWDGASPFNAAYTLQQILTSVLFGDYTTTDPISTEDESNYVDVVEDERIFCGDAPAMIQPLRPNTVAHEIVENTLLFDISDRTTLAFDPVGFTATITVKKTQANWSLFSVSEGGVANIPDRLLGADASAADVAGLFATVFGVEPDDQTRNDATANWEYVLEFNVGNYDAVNWVVDGDIKIAAADSTWTFSTRQDGSPLAVLASAAIPGISFDDHALLNNEAESLSEQDMGSVTGMGTLGLAIVNRQVYPLDSNIVIDSVEFSNPAFSTTLDTPVGLYGWSNTPAFGFYPNSAVALPIMFDGTVGLQTCIVTVNYTMSDVTSSGKTGTFIFTVKATGVAASNGGSSGMTGIFG